MAGRRLIINSGTRYDPKALSPLVDQLNNIQNRQLKEQNLALLADENQRKQQDQDYKIEQRSKLSEVLSSARSLPDAVQQNIGNEVVSEFQANPKLQSIADKLMAGDSVSPEEQSYYDSWFDNNAKAGRAMELTTPEQMNNFVDQAQRIGLDPAMAKDQMDVYKSLVETMNPKTGSQPKPPRQSILEDYSKALFKTAESGDSSGSGAVGSKGGTGGLTTGYKYNPSQQKNYANTVQSILDDTHGKNKKTSMNVVTGLYSAGVSPSAIDMIYSMTKSITGADRFKPDQLEKLGYKNVAVVLEKLMNDPTDVSDEEIRKAFIDDNKEGLLVERKTQGSLASIADRQKRVNKAFEQLNEIAGAYGITPTLSKPAVRKSEDIEKNVVSIIDDFNKKAAAVTANAPKSRTEMIEKEAAKQSLTRHPLNVEPASVGTSDTGQMTYDGVPVYTSQAPLMEPLDTALQTGNTIVAPKAAPVPDAEILSQPTTQPVVPSIDPERADYLQMNYNTETGNLGKWQSLANRQPETPQQIETLRNAGRFIQSNQSVQRLSERFGLDRNQLAQDIQAILAAESNYGTTRSKDTGNDKAFGITQVTPSTLSDLVKNGYITKDDIANLTDNGDFAASAVYNMLKNGNTSSAKDLLSNNDDFALLAAIAKLAQMKKREDNLKK